jgi:hypothetical protein
LKKLHLLAVFALMSGTQVALAQITLNLNPGTQFDYNSTTVGQPTFHRPGSGTPPTTQSGSATAVRYAVQSFKVATSGRYNFTTNSNIPGAAFSMYSFLYGGNFNPASSLSNILVGVNNFFNDATRTTFYANLTAGTTYHHVVSGNSNATAGAFAATISRTAAAANFSGSLSATDPKWWRTNLTGTSLSVGNSDLHYDVQSFKVTKTGTYTLRSNQNYNGFIALYKTSFNPTPAGASGNNSSTLNFLAANDTGPTLDPGFAFSSEIDATLTAGEEYFFVTSSSTNNLTGNYSNSIYGVGNVTGVVPEPTTILVVAGGIAAMVRRRRKA